MSQELKGRYDYIKFDGEATAVMAKLKAQFEELTSLVEALGTNRPTSLALTSLEEAYMWCGKAVRDMQIAHGGNSQDVPERGE